MRNERGFALILTLLVTALLVALTAEFIDEVFVDSSARANYVDGQQASLLAASGIEGAKKLIQTQAQFQSESKQYSSQTDLDLLSRLLTIEDENGTIRVIAEEESGKLNINALVSPRGDDNSNFRPIAESLFKKLGLNPQLVDALADWISTRDVARANGAKSPYYQTLNPPYAAKGGPMDTLEELRLVKGFDGATVEKLRPYLTVYPVNTGGLGSPINVNTAARELLASLDEAMTDALAQAIIDKRKLAPFKNIGELSQVTGMGALAPALGITRINCKGSIFRIISQAQVKDTIRVVEAVVETGGKNLYWREY